MYSAAGTIDVATAATMAQHPEARIAIAGVSGAGKTTLAQAMSRMLDLPYTELDSLHWGADWTPRPQFVDDVTVLIEQPAWITEWQYRAVRPTILDRATLLVWIDSPFPLTFARVVRRTVRRTMRSEELWNGNREPGIRHAIVHPEGIIRWAFATRKKYRHLITAAMSERPDLPVVRLRARAHVTKLLALLDQPDRLHNSGEGDGHEPRHA